MALEIPGIRPTNRQLAAGVFLCSVFLLESCMPFGDISKYRGAIGTTSNGILVNGGHLPYKGTHHRFYHGGDRRWGVPELCGMIERAAAAVANNHEGSTLLVGDMSARNGGFIGGHRSHRNGRDVDFAFYVRKKRNRQIDGYPLPKFDRWGVGLRQERALVFDTARNWALVEAMLTDPEANVQWIFVSNGLKALILEWALQNNRDLDIILKAASILHQPGDSLPHNDHFHVRIYCPQKTPYSQCIDVGPFWPWVPPMPTEPHFSDEDLARLTLED